MLIIERICGKKSLLIDISKRNYKAVFPTIFGRNGSSLKLKICSYGLNS